MVKIISELPSYAEFRKKFAQVNGSDELRFHIEFDDGGHKTEGEVVIEFVGHNQHPSAAKGLATKPVQEFIIAVCDDSGNDLSSYYFEGRKNAWFYFNWKLEDACDELPKDESYQLAKAAWLAKDLQRQLHEQVASGSSKPKQGRL